MRITGRTAPYWRQLPFLLGAIVAVCLSVYLGMAAMKPDASRIIRVGAVSFLVFSATVIWAALQPDARSRGILRRLWEETPYRAVVSISVFVPIAIYCVDQPPTQVENLVNFATAVGVFVAIWTFYRSSWISLRNQRIAVRIACIDRYDKFAETRPDFTKKTKANQKLISTYFRRHWAIKKDQLDFWIAGYVDPNALVSWFMSDVGYFSGSHTAIPQEDFIKHWELVRNQPGSVDDTLIWLVDRMRADVAKLPCVDRSCDCRVKSSCSTQQRAGLFWLLMQLEKEQWWSIVVGEAHGVGRRTFASVHRQCPEEMRARIDSAGRAIDARRKLRA